MKFQQTKNQVCFIYLFFLLSPSVSFLFVLLARERKVCQVSSSHLLGRQCQTGLCAIINKLLGVYFSVMSLSAPVRAQPRLRRSTRNESATF